jgi:hypothetical protein
MKAPDRRFLIMDRIIEDMENDVRSFEGRPLNGKTIGEMHGNLAAAIGALAETIKTMLEEKK